MQRRVTLDGKICTFRVKYAVAEGARRVKPVLHHQRATETDACTLEFTTVRVFGGDARGRGSETCVRSSVPVCTEGGSAGPQVRFSPRSGPG